MGKGGWIMRGGRRDGCGSINGRGELDFDYLGWAAQVGKDDWGAAGVGERVRGERGLRIDNI